jgi:hypothetical protein
MRNVKQTKDTLRSYFWLVILFTVPWNNPCLYFLLYLCCDPHWIPKYCAWSLVWAMCYWHQPAWNPIFKAIIVKSNGWEGERGGRRRLLKGELGGGAHRLMYGMCRTSRRDIVSTEIKGDIQLESTCRYPLNGTSTILYTSLICK